MGVILYQFALAEMPTAKERLSFKTGLNFIKIIEVRNHFEWGTIVQSNVISLWDVERRHSSSGRCRERLSNLFTDIGVRFNLVWLHISLNRLRLSQILQRYVDKNAQVLIEEESNFYVITCAPL